MNYIFDFDGTIADSLPAFIAVFNKTVRGGSDPLTAAEIQKLREMPSRKALKMAGVRWWQVPRLVLQGISDFHALVPTLKTFPGVSEAVEKLYSRGDRLFIVTSNTRESVDIFLIKHNLDGFFEDISTGAGLFNKARYIRRLMKQHDLKRRQTLYVGDETRDIQAARLALIKVVAVTWGFNTAAVLKRHRPTYMIDRPKDLLGLGVPK